MCELARRQSENQEIAPRVNDALRQVRLLKQAVDIQSGGGATLPSNLTEQIVYTVDEWKNNLQPLPVYNQTVLGSLSSIGIANVAEMRNFMVHRGGTANIQASLPVPNLLRLMLPN
jgi:hypothetical protein